MHKVIPICNIHCTVFCFLAFFIFNYVQAQDIEGLNIRPVVCHDRLELPLIPPRYGGPVAPTIALGEDGLPLPPIPNPLPRPNWELKDEYKKIPLFESAVQAFEVKVLNDLDSEAYELGSIFFNAYTKLLSDEKLMLDSTLEGYGHYGPRTGSATFFVPTNTALQKYIEEKGFNTIDEFYIQQPLEFRRFMLRHTSPFVYSLKSLFHFELKHIHPESTYAHSPFYPLRSVFGGEVLHVTDNCVEVFINGVKIYTSEIAIYRQEYKYRPQGLKYMESPSYVYFMEGVLVP